MGKNSGDINFNVFYRILAGAVEREVGGGYGQLEIRRPGIMVLGNHAPHFIFLLGVV